MAGELAAAGISGLEVFEHVGHDACEFLRVGRTCLEAHAGLRKLGLESTHVPRLLLHARMVRAQEDFGRRCGPLAGAGMALGLPTMQPVLQRFVDYEARCAREVSLCSCGPTGVAQLDSELRGLPPAHQEAAETFAALRDLNRRVGQGEFQIGDGITGSAKAFREAGAVLSQDIPDDRRVTMRAPIREVDRVVEKSLHPCGRCTCGVGGFGGTCDWCVMDWRRMLREARHVRRTERDQDESERKVKHRKARAKLKARRGW